MIYENRFILNVLSWAWSIVEVIGAAFGGVVNIVLAFNDSKRILFLDPIWSSPQLWFSVIFVLLCIHKMIAVFKSTIPDLPPLLFTKTNESASLPAIAIALANHYKTDESRLMYLLLQGYWNGCFDFKNVQGPPRLQMLKVMHDCSIPKVSEQFNFHYAPERRPETSWLLPDGSSEIDSRPVLEVPNKNTNTWTLENCQKAFQTLAKEPIYFDNLWPNYMVLDLLAPVFYSIKIPKVILVRFMRHEGFK